MARQRGQRLVSDERGEISSWLIVAAGLALAASLASGTLSSVISQLAANIATASGVAVETAAAGPGPSGDATDTSDSASGGGSGDSTESSDDSSDDSTESASEPAPPTAAQIADIDRTVLEIANAIDGPSSTDARREQQEQLEQIFDNDADVAAARALLDDGASIDVAYAQITGDWTGIPGGDPADYTDEQRAHVLEVLGIDSPVDGEGIPELFDSIPEWALSDVFNAGRTNQNAIAAGPSELSSEGTTSLSNPQIGVGFTQTQTATVTIETRTSESGVEISAPAALRAVGTSVNLLTAAGRLPAPLTAVIANSPGLATALKAVSFELTVNQFEGTQVQYEATLNEAQAHALDDGHTNVLPDLYNPESFEVGNSALIRGGDVEGTEFAIGYKGVSFGSEATEFSGLGWGVTNLGDGVFAIYEGDIEEVERQLAIGAGPFALVASTSVTGSEFDYAQVDIDTPEGAAAYDAFVSGRGIPASNGTGVVTAVTESVTVNSQLGFRVGFGDWSETASLINESADRTVTTLSDGSATSTATFSNEVTQIQVVAPVNADGSSDNDNAVLTIVWADVDPNTANSLATAFDGDHPEPGTNQHVQVQFTSDELLGLRDYAATQENSSSQLVQDLGAARNADEVMVILVNNANLRGTEGATVIGNLASTARNEDGERFLGALEGDATFRES